MFECAEQKEYLMFVFPRNSHTAGGRAIDHFALLQRLPHLVLRDCEAVATDLMHLTGRGVDSHKPHPTVCVCVCVFVWYSQIQMRGTFIMRLSMINTKIMHLLHKRMNETKEWR